MILTNELQQLHADMRLWRQHLHQFPETAFEGNPKRQKFIADKTDQFRDWMFIKD